jgi:small conductance mechanosensitive channel
MSPDQILALILDPLRATISALVLAFAFWLAALLADRGLLRLSTRSNVDPTMMVFLRSVLRYSFLGAGAVAALGELGVNTGSLLASLGLVGLTVGFAAKDALSNVISGVFIFWDRPFVLDDLVEIDGRYGRVEGITLRSTRLVTPEGTMIAIPNTTVVNGMVTSYTNFPHLRLEIDVTISVHEDIGQARRVMLELTRDPAIYMAEPAPEVVVTSLNDYNLALQLRAWIHDEKQHIARRGALREQVFEALRTAGVDMPYETIKLEPLTIAQAG